MNILQKLRAINVDYHQVGWYQSTYLSSHVTKEFLESHVRYQQAISESVVLIYGKNFVQYKSFVFIEGWEIPSTSPSVHWYTCMYTVMQCGPQKLNKEGMYMVQNGSHTYLTNI